MVATRFCSCIMSTSLKYKRHIQLCCLAALSVLIMGFLNTVSAQPTFLNLPKSLEGLPSQNTKQMKTYSGKRLSNDSLIKIFYHEATVAVAEFDPQKGLLGCELIEIYTDDNNRTLPQDLSKYNHSLEIGLQAMIRVMHVCEDFDEHKDADIYVVNTTGSIAERTTNSETSEAFNLLENALPSNQLSLWSGIVPGTKWCGEGDIAETYHDLGTEIKTDRCCRVHDLCPVKLRANESKTDLTNDYPYKISHCTCDYMFYSCLKIANTTASQFVGSLYFNVIDEPCVSGENNNFNLEWFRLQKF